MVMRISPNDPMGERLVNAAQEIREHLLEALVPFWLRHGVDKHFGGFLTYFDGRGKPTDETVKTLPCQMGMLYAASTAHRNHLGDGAFLRIAQEGMNFLVNHFWDDEHTGWHWTCGRDGIPIDSRKRCCGQGLALYALSEYAMASGDVRGQELATETYKSLTTLGADTEHGGFTTLLGADWESVSGGSEGEMPCKSLDDHLLLLAAFTNLFEATGEDCYKGDAQYMLDLVLTHLIDARSGTTASHRNLDWSPLGVGRAAAGWEHAHEIGGTNYEQNMGLASQMDHSARLLDFGMARYEAFVRGLYDHCLKFGLDKARGGVYRGGACDASATDRCKDYKTQAFALVGMLDAYHRFGEEKYFDAFENVLHFTMENLVNHKAGEWMGSCGEDGAPEDRQLGDGYKTGATTLHSMVQCELRLGRMLGEHLAQSRKDAAGEEKRERGSENI